VTVKEVATNLIAHAHNNMKTPKVNKSKEQLAHEIKLRDEVNRQKKIVTEVLYPILHEHATSIAHAQQSCQVMKVVLLQAMQKPFRESNVSELHLDEELTKEKDVKDKMMFEAFNTGFKDYKISDVLKILEGMGGAIDGYIRQKADKEDFKNIKVEDLVN
jgi:hypothetical protein